MKKILAFVLLIALTVTVCGCSKLDEMAYPPLDEKNKEDFVHFLEEFTNAVHNLNGDALQRMYSNDVFFIETAQWLSQQPDLSKDQMNVFWATSIITDMMRSEEAYTTDQLKNMTLLYNKDSMCGMTSSFMKVDIKIGFDGNPENGRPAVLTMQLVRDPIGGAMRPAIFLIDFDED